MPLITYTNLEDNVDDASANNFNERFGAIIDVVNGNLDSANFKAGGIPASALAPEIFARMYPVGSIYINASDDTNPGTLLGVGTWEAFGTGRVLVGYDASQTEFNAAQKEGGDKNLQAHDHNGTTDTQGAHTHSTTSQVAIRTNSTVGLTNLKTDQFSWGNVNTNSAGAHSHFFNTSTTGTGNSGNLQPYITVYIWKRVS